MTDIPPKQSPDATPYDPPEASGGLVAMYQAASHANAESFPVLKAFQDYIEAERSHARKRVMQLSVFFSVLMGFVVAGFISAGIFMWRNMAEVQNKLLDVALASKNEVAQVQQAPAPQSSVLFEESMRHLSRTTDDLKSTLDKKLDGVSEITTKVHERIASQDQEMDKLRSELIKMQQQNSKVSEELLAIRKNAEKAASTPAQPAKPIAPPVVPPSAVVQSAVKPVPEKKPDPAPVAIVSTPPLPPKETPPTVNFPPATKDPPITPTGVKAPDAPSGMTASTLAIKTKNSGTLQWHVMLPE